MYIIGFLAQEACQKLTSTGSVRRKLECSTVNCGSCYVNDLAECEALSTISFFYVPSNVSAISADDDFSCLHETCVICNKHALKKWGRPWK